MDDKILLNSRGQIVPLILLVILVGATIGFSIAGTTIKNIQETSLNEESNRAYSAAEAGLEEKLLELESGVPVAQLTPVSLQSGAYIKQVLVEQDDALEIDELDKDGVAQVNLECDGCSNGGNVDITWDSLSSLVITKISGYAEPYTVTRYAYDCAVVGGTFNSSIPTGGQCTESIAVDGRLAAQGGDDDRLLRIRAMYNSTYLAVTPDAGVVPIQSTVLTSTGLSGETERTVQVQRSEPVAPSILDYVLFSSQGSLEK